VRFTSIRARVALLSILFAVLLVGGLTTATYFFVASGMADAAEDTSTRLAAVSTRVINRTVDEAIAEAEGQGLTGSTADEFVADAVLGGVPDAISRGLVYEGGFTMYARTAGDSAWRVAWSSDQPERELSAQVLLERAIDSRESVHEATGEGALLSGMYTPVDLGHFVVYTPIDVPGLRAVVLASTYTPEREEAILNATRAPMTAVALVSLVAALLITAMTTGWTLSLVDNLRRTADSVDIGKLDVHLPEEGDNEVAELARSLNRVIDSLRRQNEAQSRFIADASHELATPVAGIRGYVNILRAWGAEDPALREEAVSAIDRESRRMARLCSELLSVIRNEEVAEYRQLRYDVNAVSREVLANAATRYMDKHLDFTGPDEGPLWLYGDPDRIEEALGILVDNACKYTPDAGQVRIVTRRHRDRVVIEVTDTGVGIPAKDLPNVFDRFYRSDLSRSKETGGFGLGLAIARHVVDASGGTIRVRSAIGKGTTFEVTLPRQKTRSQ